MRLIDACKLQNEYKNRHDGKRLLLIDVAPTVNAVPVVMCKDCELWNEWDSAGKESFGNYVCSCAHWTVEDGAVIYTRSTDYCSYGERKGGGTSDV